MRVLNAVVITAALGTFVDVVDLTLFQSVRVPSLRDLGATGEDVFRSGILILNTQMAGLFLGGLLWGALADRRGRRAVLFASIVMYSLATLACAFVTSIPSYAALRFLAGIGLAGEMGAGITLIAEVMPRETRGYGTMVSAAAGVSGALFAALLASYVPWRTCYVVGGLAGLALFFLRTATYESSLFHRSRGEAKQRGLFTLLRKWATLRRYLFSLALGLPLFFVLAVIGPFAPEFGAAATPRHTITAAAATGLIAVGLTVGDVGTAVLSQKLRSRKRPLAYCIVTVAFLLAVFFFVPLPSDHSYLAIILLMGLTCGYFVLFLTNAAEQFGTNIRGSAAVAAPNIMRAAMIPITLALRGLTGSIGIRAAGATLAFGCVLAALFSLRQLPETFGRDLDYDE